MWRTQILSLLVFLSPGMAWCQASAGFGAVTGFILDPAGSGLPDSTVVLSNEDLGAEHTMNTTDDGLFNAPTVVPFAGYRLRVNRKGSASWESDEFAVSTGQKLSFVVTLQAVEGNTKTEGQGRQRLVGDAPVGLEGVVSALQVDAAPASGRRLDGLVPLAPAVTTAGSPPGALVFHGVPFSNRFLTDGLSTTDTYYPERPGIANQLSLDAVQAFHVASAGFLAEFGGTMGGIVNAATRSGTTDYHGEAYEYFRPRSLQAEDRYAMGYNTRQLQHQAGANLGGPIHADKLFFFLNFEALSRNAQGLNRITNPLIADASGTHVLASNCQATAAQCAVATRFLQSQMNVLTPLWEHSLRGLAKIDYRRSDRNSFSFDLNAMQSHAPALAETEEVAPNGGLLNEPLVRERTRYAKAGWTVTGSSQITNDLRAGWFQDRVAEYPNTTSGLPAGLPGISIAGTTVGVIQPYTAILPSESRFQLVDIGNWTLGSHSIKAGAEYSKNEDYLNSLDNAAGWYDYSSLTNFAQDFGLTGLRNYTTFRQTLGNPIRSLKMREMNFFAEDTWKATGRLTVDFGLRYDRPRLPQPTQTNTAFYQTGSITAPWLDLSPRVGASFMLNERTVVRGGFGFYYAPYSGQLLDALFLGNGLYQTSVSVNPNQGGAPVFPSIFPLVSKVPNGVTNVTYTTSTFHNAYAQEASVAIERQVGADTTVTLSFLGSRGKRLWTTQDANLVTPPTQSETYNVNNAGGQAVSTYTTQVWTGKINNNFAHAYLIENGGLSWYNAAALQVRKRMSHGLSLAASYTFSHTIDNTGQNPAFGTAFSSTFNANYNGDKGNSAFDQRQHALIQWVWQPTVTKSTSLAARYLLNGWQVSTLTTLGSSRRASAIVIVQGQQFSGITMDYTSSLNGSGGWARVPFLPVNSLQTGPQYDVGARIARTLPITERVKATLLFEAFNVFNTQYNTGVNTIAYTSFAPPPPGQINGVRIGALTPVAGLGAGNAAQGSPDGTNARRCQVALRIVF